MLFEFDKTPNENIYKLLVSTVVPRPIAWVTTQDIDGSVNAAPFSFFNAVSGNPPVVAIGIGGRALHVEAEAVAVELDRLVEVTDDRAEEVARADDEPVLGAQDSVERPFQGRGHERCDDECRPRA